MIKKMETENTVNKNILLLSVSLKQRDISISKKENALDLSTRVQVLEVLEERGSMVQVITSCSECALQ